MYPLSPGAFWNGVANALQVAPPSEWPAELVEQAMQSTRVLSGTLRPFRAALERAVQGGLPGHVALTQGAQLLTTADKYCAMADQVRKARAASGALPAEADALIAAVLEMLAEFEALRRLMAPVVAKLKAPPPPLDAVRLEEGVEAIRKGDFRVYSDAEDMARDLAGG